MDITKADERNRKILFAVSAQGQGDSVPVVIVGIPKGAWDYMRDGKTNTLDLTRIGIKFKLLMFGCDTHEQGRSWLNLAEAKDVSELDLSIKPKDPTS